MPKLPQVSGKDVIKVLKRIGFEIVSQRGSHVKLRRNFKGNNQTVTVPNHKIIRKGTLRNGILKAIDLSVDDFVKLL